MKEQLKVLETAWKIYKSNKYRKGDANLIIIGEKGSRTFIGILCSVLKKKLDLRWVTRDDNMVNIGRNLNDSYMPPELVEYFKLKINGSDIYGKQQNSAETLYEYMKSYLRSF